MECSHKTERHILSKSPSLINGGFDHWSPSAMHCNEVRCCEIQRVFWWNWWMMMSACLPVVVEYFIEFFQATPESFTIIKMSNDFLIPEKWEFVYGLFSKCHNYYHNSVFMILPSVWLCQVHNITSSVPIPWVIVIQVKQKGSPVAVTPGVLQQNLLELTDLLSFFLMLWPSWSKSCEQQHLVYEDHEYGDDDDQR